MMKSILKMGLLIIVFLVGCKKNNESVIEPTVFTVKECPCGNTLVKKCDNNFLTLEVKNVKGNLFKSSADLTAYRIELENVENIVVPEEQFPIWKYWRFHIIPCNMPEELYKKQNGTRVLINFKILYVPPFKNGQIPQADGYPVELTAIELK